MIQTKPENEKMFQRKSIQRRTLLQLVHSIEQYCLVLHFVMKPKCFWIYQKCYVSKNLNNKQKKRGKLRETADALLEEELEDRTFQDVRSAVVVFDDMLDGNRKV